MNGRLWLLGRRMPAMLAVAALAGGLLAGAGGVTSVSAGSNGSNGGTNAYDSNAPQTPPPPVTGAVNAQGQPIPNTSAVPVTGVVVNAVPTTASLSAGGPYSGTIGSSISFSAPASGWVSPVFTWSFGDGTSAVGQSTSHAYGAPGTYTVSVSVIDQTTLQQSSATTTATVSGGAAIPGYPYQPYTGYPYQSPYNPYPTATGQTCTGFSVTSGYYSYPC